MNQCAEWAACEPVCSDAMKQVLTRHSVGPKHLVPPAPTQEQVWIAACAALRAPDHQKLSPFRFVLIPDDVRPVLGELFSDFARRSAKMLSGRKAADPVIREAFCEPGETLVGWIAVGTASKGTASAL